MRLLIAAGGTGGHIYPALAVARSLLAQPDAPELSWVGGHRGLEAQLVRSADLPLTRLALRSLRTVDLSVNTVLDPARLALSVPQATALLARRRPAAIFTTGGYVAIPVLLAAAPLRIPTVLWEGNVDPRPQRPRGGPAGDVSRRLVRGHVPNPRRSLLPDRHADPRHARDRPGRGSPAAGPAAGLADAAHLRRQPGRAPVQQRPSRRRCRGSSSGSTSSTSPATRATRAPSPTASGCRADLRDRYRPYPFLRDDMLAALAAADLVVGRAGSSTLAEATALGLPMVVVPYPHAAGHQRANARALVEAGGALLVEDDDFDADALLAAAAILDDPGRARSHGRRLALPRPAGGRRGSRAARHGGRRAAARAGSGAARAAVAGPGDAADRPIDRGGPPTAASRALRRAPPGRRHPAPPRRQDVARRAARPLHDDARRRPGGPVRGRPQRLRAARPAAVRAVAGHPARRPGARQRHRHQRSRRPRPGHPEPGRGRRDQRRAPRRGVGPADGARRHRHPAGRPVGPRVRARHPGHRRRRRVGQRRRARVGRRRRPGVGGRAHRRTAARPRSVRRTSAWPTATLASRRPTRPRPRSWSPPPSPFARLRRRDQGPPRRHQALAPGPPAAGDPQRRQRSSATRRLARRPAR